MKTLSMILLLVIVPVAVIGQNLKVLDDKYGFRNVKFEMPLDSLKNLVETETGALVIYKSTNEDLSMGAYTLDGISYCFYKGQLAVIVIHTKEYTNSMGFLKILQNAYGNGYQSNSYIEDYYWRGRKVTMSYSQNSITDDAIIIIQSVKLRKLREADETRANSDAAKKL